MKLRMGFQFTCIVMARVGKDTLKMLADLAVGVGMDLTIRESGRRQGDARELDNPRDSTGPVPRLSPGPCKCYTSLLLISSVGYLYRCPCSAEYLPQSNY